MVRTGGWRIRTSACLLLLALGLAGCGDSPAATDGVDGASSPSTSGPAGRETAPPGTPDCEDVWQDGERLPRSYRGCVDASGEYVVRDGLSCSSGQLMVRYDDRYYGVLAGTVHEAAEPLDQDRDYRTAVRSCRA
jgi:hypothetical protein